jgi:hypothetical protein
MHLVVIKLKIISLRRFRRNIFSIYVVSHYRSLRILEMQIRWEMVDTGYSLPLSSQGWVEVQRRLRMVVMLLVGSVHTHLRHFQLNFLPMSSVKSGIIKRVCVCVCVYVCVCACVCVCVCLCVCPTAAQTRVLENRIELLVRDTCGPVTVVGNLWFTNHNFCYCDTEAYSDRISVELCRISHLRKDLMNMD